MSPEHRSDSDDIYATDLTASEREGEHQKHQSITFEDDELILEQRVELRYKRMNDPSMIRNPRPTTPPLAIEQAVILAYRL